jgi:hypothetical protein
MRPPPGLIAILTVMGATCLQAEGRLGRFCRVCSSRSRGCAAVAGDRRAIGIPEAVSAGGCFTHAFLTLRTIRGQDENSLCGKTTYRGASDEMSDGCPIHGLAAHERAGCRARLGERSDERTAN